VFGLGVSAPGCGINLIDVQFLPPPNSRVDVLFATKRNFPVGSTVRTFGDDPDPEANGEFGTSVSAPEAGLIANTEIFVGGLIRDE